MAVVQNMIVSDKFNTEKLVLMERVLRNASLNCVSINLKFLLIPCYILKHFVENRSYMLLSELFLNVTNINVMCAECWDYIFGICPDGSSVQKWMAVCIIANLMFMLVSPNRLKYFKNTRCHSLQNSLNFLINFNFHEQEGK